MKVRRTDGGEIEILLEGNDLSHLERDLIRTVEFEGAELSIIVDHRDLGEARLNQIAPKDSW